MRNGRVEYRIDANGQEYLTGPPSSVLLDEALPIQPSSGRISFEPKATDLSRVTVARSVSGGGITPEDRDKARAEALRALFGH